MNKTNNRIIELESKVGFYQKLIVCLVALGILVYLIGVFSFNRGNNRLNEFGDFVGGAAGSLWSLAGIIYVYVAFLGQQIQVEYQKIELDFTQTEFLKQSFENSFFQLLQNHFNIILSLDLGSGDTKSTGSDCFKFFLRKLNSKLNELRGLNGSEVEKIRKAFYNLHQEHINDLDHTFKSIIMIMNHIDLATITINKEYYFEVLLSQLANDEKVLLFYYSFCNRNLRQLILKYELIKFMEGESLINKDHIALLSQVEG